MNAPTPEQLAELQRLRRELDRRSRNTYVAQAPTPRQAEFLACTELEALYGGAAGGGKSSALLMAALQYVHVPGYAALILRRTYADLALPGAIMARSHEWLEGSDAVWNGTDKRWTFPSGATLSFGYLDTDRDRFRYQGAEMQTICFDELTQFPEQWYRYLLSRLRRVRGIDVPLRARAASNPGGVGHDWVRRRFVEGDKRYVPATLEDNPHLNQEEYRRSLEQLDTTTRRQLLDGVWVRDSGGLVYAYDDAINRAPTPVSLKGWSFVLGIDFGFVDATAWAVLGWAPHDKRVHVLESFKREKLTPSDAGEVTRALCARYTFDRIVGDEGGLGKGYAEEIRKRFHIPIEPADKRNKRGYIDLLNGDLRHGRLVVCPGNDALVKEWCELPWDEQRAKEAPGFENHLCLVGGTMVTTPDGSQPVESLRVGDMVMTRRGPRMVTAAWCTGVRELWRLETTDGRSLLGTSNHPVFTVENGMVSLDALLYGHTLVTCENQSWWCSMANGSDATRSHHARSCATTSRANAGGAFTSLFGSMRTGPFRRATTSTIATATRSTTPSTISSASTGGSISVSTCDGLRSRRSHGQLLSKPLQPLLHGTARKQGELGTANTDARRGWGGRATRMFAWCAAGITRLAALGRRCVPRSASQSSAETVVSTTSTRCAPSAPQASEPIGTQNRCAAPCRVQRVSKTGLVSPVYDLTVDGEHEFFADGILVSNSDACLYAFRACSAFAEEPAPVPQAEGDRLLEERIERLQTQADDWWA